MEDDKLSFLDETPEEAEMSVEEPEEIAEPEPEQQAELEAAVEEQAGEKDEAEPQSEPTPGDETERHIPLTALLDEREKRQEAMRKAEEAERRLQAYERQRQQQQAQQQKPDFFDNPEAVLNAQLTSVKLEQSRFLAEREFGADVVNEAFEYFNLHPEESQQLLKHPSPFHAAVEHYKRQKFFTEVSDPDAWREQERERIRAEIAAEMQGTPTSKPKAPPPSMARASAAGKDAIAPGNAFDNMFPE